MASIEFIQNRIAGTQKNIAKLEKKAERIAKAKATNWEVNPYYYSEYDERSTAKDLEAARKNLEKYTAQLAQETEKAASRNVPVILEFLDRWQDRVFKFYVNAHPAFIEALNDWYKEDSDYCDWFNHDSHNATVEERKARRIAHQDAKKEFQATWGWMEQYCDYRHKLDTEKLRKELKQEANRKYDFIIERTNAICGEITDAAGLTIGEKDDLNGFIIGKKGTAKVQTIGAGGYNIQCYHFRTLIHELKK